MINFTGQAERGELSKNKEIDEITGQAVDAAYKLYTGLGPGLLESVYELLLARELERRGFRMKRQKSVSFEFDGLQFDDAFRVDLLIEPFSVELIRPVAASISLDYLNILSFEYLSNFGFRASYLAAAMPLCARSGHAAHANF